MDTTEVISYSTEASSNETSVIDWEVNDISHEGNRRTEVKVNCNGPENKTDEDVSKFLSDNTNGCLTVESLKTLIDSFDLMRDSKNIFPATYTTCDDNNVDYLCYGILYKGAKSKELMQYIRANNYEVYSINDFFKCCYRLPIENYNIDIWFIAFSFALCDEDGNPI